MGLTLPPHARWRAGSSSPPTRPFERRGAYVISSIGSIPEPIPGIPMKGELFAFTDWDVGRLDGYPSVFSVGNVVTGKGNIVASRKHAAQVYEDGARVVPRARGGRARGRGGARRAAHEAAARAAAEPRRRARSAQAEPPAPAVARARSSRACASASARSATAATSRAWLDKVTPPDLE